MYDAADSVHVGEVFHVYDTGNGSVTIVRLADGAERFLQPEDGGRLVDELDAYLLAFEFNGKYVAEADHMLSEFFSE